MTQFFQIHSTDVATQTLSAHRREDCVRSLTCEMCDGILAVQCPDVDSYDLKPCVHGPYVLVVCTGLYRLNLQTRVLR